MSIGGTCGKCGAPWFYDHVGAWHGILPPPIRPSCACWNIPATITGRSSFVFNPPVSESATCTAPGPKRCGHTRTTGEKADPDRTIWMRCIDCGAEWRDDGQGWRKP